MAVDLAGYLDMALRLLGAARVELAQTQQQLAQARQELQQAQEELARLKPPPQADG